MSIAPANSLPQWQVDIPSLSQLLVSAGSHGLKQLSLCGVDIHSIGCMLMIAELTPACQEFRKTLNLVRDKQRAEKMWMYKVVEIGGATNFLADQMLKTRAGENVLALLSSTIPVMDEETCTSLMSALFDSVNVSLDNIPGTKQLQCIRSALVSLTRKVGFGEKVLQYQSFLWGIIGRPGRDEMHYDPYQAVPDPVDMPNIIRMFYKVKISDDSHVMIFSGTTGAAWILAYSCFVLGLNTCVLDKAGSSVPVIGTYKDAKVIVDVASLESKCATYVAGQIQELIRFNSATDTIRQGWSLDCSIINFLDLQHPNLKNSLQYGPISRYVAIRVMDKILRMTGSFEKVEARTRAYNAGFLTYTSSIAPELQKRGLRILRWLGFDPGLLEDYVFEEYRGCETFTCLRHKPDAPTPNESNDIGKSTDEPDHPKKSKEYNYENNHSNSHTEVPLDTIGISRTKEMAVNFAAKLAFSDWDETLRMMNVRCLGYGRGALTDSSDRVFEGHITEAISLCTDSISTAQLEKRLWTRDWIGIDLDGVIVFRNTSRIFSIDGLKGAFLGFSLGRILFEGTPCFQIRSDTIDVSSENFRLASRISADATFFAPKNGFPDLELRSLCTNIRDTIYVRLEVFDQNGMHANIDSSSLMEVIPDILVTQPCGHGYYTPFDPSPVHEEKNKAQRYGKPTMVAGSDTYTGSQRFFEGLAFGIRDLGQHITGKARHDYLYQQSDQNSFAQWAACHWKCERDTQSRNNPRSLIVLQKNCCLECIRRNISKAYTPRLALKVCVIAGRVEGEDLLTE